MANKIVFLSVDATPEEMRQLADKLKEVTGYDFIVVPSDVTVLRKDEVTEVIKKLVTTLVGDIQKTVTTSEIGGYKLELFKRMVIALESIAKSLRQK